MEKAKLYVPHLECNKCLINVGSPRCYYLPGVAAGPEEVSEGQQAPLVEALWAEGQLSKGPIT